MCFLLVFFSVLLESANLLTAFRSLKLPPLARSSGKRQQRPGKTSRLGQTGRLANCPVRCNRTFACGCQIKDNHFVNEVAHGHRLVVCHGGSFIFGTISLRPSFFWGGRKDFCSMVLDDCVCRDINSSWSELSLPFIYFALR